MELTGKTALVLGATGGIGRAVACELLARGMNVVANWFDWESRLPGLEKDLAAAGAEYLLVRSNLLENGAAQDLAVRAVARFGSLDVLVNNIERGGWPIVHGDYTSDQWDLEMATTLAAKKWMFEAALPHLRATGKGAVINISSIAAQIGRSGPAAAVFSEGYAAASRGVSSLTSGWARRGAPQVRVNEVMLGFFETRHGPGTRGWELLQPEQKKALADHTLLGRTGLAKEAARAVTFIIKDASFMTGGRLVLDGGYLLGGDKAQPMPRGEVSPGESVYGD